MSGVSKMFILGGITAFFGFIYMIYNKMNPKAFGFPRGKKASILDPFYFFYDYHVRPWAMVITAQRITSPRCSSWRNKVYFSSRLFHGLVRGSP